MPLSNLHRFQHLRVSRTARHGEPSCKPALLLAVPDGIAGGSIRHNRTEITPELTAAFPATCTDLGSGQHFTAHNFALPFYHLPGDKLWPCTPGPGWHCCCSRHLRNSRGRSNV